MDNYSLKAPSGRGIPVGLTEDPLQQQQQRLLQQQEALQRRQQQVLQLQQESVHQKRHLLQLPNQQQVLQEQQQLLQQQRQQLVLQQQQQQLVLQQQQEAFHHALAYEREHQRHRHHQQQQHQQQQAGPRDLDFEFVAAQRVTRLLERLHREAKEEGWGHFVWRSEMQLMVSRFLRKKLNYWRYTRKPRGEEERGQAAIFLFSERGKVEQAVLELQRDMHFRKQQHQLLLSRRQQQQQGEQEPSEEVRPASLSEEIKAGRDLIREVHALRSDALLLGRGTLISKVELLLSHARPLRKTLNFIQFTSEPQAPEDEVRYAVDLCSNAGVVLVRVGSSSSSRGGPRLAFVRCNAGAPSSVVPSSSCPVSHFSILVAFADPLLGPRRLEAATAACDEQQQQQQWKEQQQRGQQRQVYVHPSSRCCYGLFAARGAAEHNV
ncbi:hypothetical protein Esti_004283 [Eimeria stiedai]